MSNQKVRDTLEKISYLPKFTIKLMGLIGKSILGKLLISYKHPKNNKANKIFVVSHTRNWMEYPSTQNEYLKQDIMVGTIIKALKNQNFDVVALDQDTNLFIDFKTFFENFLLFLKSFSLL